MKCIDNNLLLFSFVHSDIPISVQFIFLFIEYCPLYLISLATPIRLLNHFLNETSVNQFAFLFRFHINTIILNQPISNIIAIVIISLILIFYWVINIFQSKTTSNKVSNIKWHNILYTIIYDIIVFRMGSFILIVILFNELVSSILHISTLNIILSIIITLLLVVFLFTLHYHISSYCIMFCLNNQDRINIVLNYPYNRNFSRQFDSYIMIYKIISGFNNAFYIAAKETQNHLDIFLNGLIVLLLLSFFIIFFNSLFINPAIEWFIFNRGVTFFRLSFIIMNFYSIVFEFFFLNATSSNFLIGIGIVISFIWSIITLLFFWRRVFQQYLNDGTLTFKKILLSLMINHHLGLLQINQKKLVDSIKNNFKLAFLTKNTSSSVSKDTATFNLMNTNTKSDIELFQIFNFFRKKQTNFLIDVFDKEYSDLLCLFYYYYKGKEVKYFSFYNSIKRKYKKDYNILSNITLFVKISLSFSNEKLSLYKYFLFDSKLSESIGTALNSFKSIFKIPNEMLKPKMIFDLAEKVNQLKSCSKNLLLNKDFDDNTYHTKQSNDQSLKLIRQQYKFCFIMRRYITETIINESLDSINYLDIELIEDYINNHYETDTILLMSIDLTRFSVKNDINLFKINKCGKELNAYENGYLANLFPKKFRREGIRAFERKLQHYVEPSIKTSLDYNNTQTTFEYFINSNTSSFIESFRYNFSIIPSLEENNILISGVYSTNETRIVLIKENSYNGDLIIENFSHCLSNWFIITPEWIQFANYCDVHITINQLFSKCSLIDKVDYDCLFIQSNVSAFTSLLNYQENEETFLTKQDYNDITEKLSIAKESKMKPVKFRLSFQFEINCNSKGKFKLFSISGLKTSSKNINNNNSIFTTTAADIVKNQANDILFDNLATTTQSSLSSSVGSLSYTERKKKQLSKQDKQVSQITKTFSKFSLLILIFNCVIILVCVIFMIIEIGLNRKLLVLSKIVCEFQSLRTNFGNTFLNIFSNICLADSRDNDFCQNGFVSFSKMLHQQHVMDPRYSMRELMISALKYKLVKLQGQTQTLKNEIYALKEIELENILQEKMEYVVLSIKDNHLIQINTMITFEEGLQNFINSASILDKAPDNFDNPKYPVFIITSKDFYSDFSNIHNQNLNNIQLEIYKLLLNFLNYTWGYINGENLLFKAFNRTESLNNNVLYSYIGLVIGLHMILALLCRYIIIIVEKLLQTFLQQIGKVIISKDNKQYFTKKMDSLLLLNSLYTKNPNSIIKKMQRNKKKIMKIYAIHNNTHYTKSKNNSNSNNNSDNNKTSKDELDKLINNSKVEIVNDKKEFKVVIKPFIWRTSLLFIIFFLSILVFDAILLDYFSTVILTYDYLISNIGIENQMYLNVAYPQIIGLLNLTQADLAKEIKLDSFDQDGVLNMKIREGIKFREAFLMQEYKHPNLFPLIDTYFGETCESIFKQTEDIIITNISQEMQLDYILFQIEMCKRYKLTTLKSFEFMYSDHNFRSQVIQNYLGSYSYEDLIKFNNHMDFFELYTLTLVNVRPLRTYIAEKILYVQMDSALSTFIQTIIGYLVFNIIADILLFFIIKIFILRTMNVLHQNLLHLSKCLNV